MDEILVNIDQTQNTIALDITETPNDVSVIVTGTRGDAGPQGATGIGVPTGGSAGWLLVKKTNANYDTQWVIQDEDIQQYPSISNFPPIGEDNILYVDMSNHTSWVWDGLTYICVGGSGAIPAGDNKQIQFNDNGVRGASVNLQFDKDSQSVLIGAGNLLPTNPLSVSGNVDSYLQINLTNKNNGGIHGSQDFIGTNDIGSDSTYYVDLGINNSSFNDPTFPYTKKNDSYLVNTGGDMQIGTIDEGADLMLMSGSDHKVHIDGNGLNVMAGNTLRVNDFNVLEIITSASSLADENNAFAMGSKIVIRTDLL